MNALYIGFSGRMGVGKNYISERLFLPLLIRSVQSKQSDCSIVPYFVSFGNSVKAECYARDSSGLLTIDTLFDGKTPETRALLQQYATENGRQRWRYDMWVRSTELWCDIQLRGLSALVDEGVKALPVFLFQDVRFPNEVEWIKSRGGTVIRIEAPQRNQERRIKECGDAPEHISESALDGYEFQYRIQNDPGEANVQEECQKIISKILIERSNV